MRPGIFRSRRSARIAASTCMPLEVTKATENAKLTQSRISDFNVASTLALAVSSLPRMRGEYLSSGSCFDPIKLDSRLSANRSAL